MWNMVYNTKSDISDQVRYNSRGYALINKPDSRLYQKVLKYLRPRPEDRILEIGCGRGFLTKKLQFFSKFTVGIDINPEAISAGVTQNLRTMDATKLEFPPESFDKIYSCHTIEHIPNLEKLFQEIERVLKPRGKVLLVYPWEIVRGMGAIGASLIFFKHPFCCRKIHLHKLSPKKLKKIIEDSQLKIIENHFSLLRTPQYFTILEKLKKNEFD